MQRIRVKERNGSKKVADGVSSDKDEDDAMRISEDR